MRAKTLVRQLRAEKFRQHKRNQYRSNLRRVFEEKYRILFQHANPPTPTVIDRIHNPDSTILRYRLQAQHKWIEWTLVHDRTCNKDTVISLNSNF